jgi:hypothetical protein
MIFPIALPAECGLDVRCGEVGTLIQERQSAFTGERVTAAISKIQASHMLTAFPEAHESRDRTDRLARSKRHHVSGYADNELIKYIACRGTMAAIKTMEVSR